MREVGSLFSGIGGIELGLERTGYFKTKWFVENNEFCQRILARHWPGIPIHGDITTLDFSKLPKVDMLTGGFPCQDISVAGRGAGIREGARSGLWFYFAKAIGILRPRYALIENVPALANRGLNIVLADLAEAGYDAEWINLSASLFAAPHPRERIFIIAYPRGLRSTPVESVWGYEDLQEKIRKVAARNKTWSGWRSRVAPHNEGNDRAVAEARMDGVVYGLPEEVDRIKSLGNAVVPDCAEFIGEMIMEYDKTEANP